MREAARLLTGTHDFSAFCAAGSQVKNKVRTIYDISLVERALPPGMRGRQFCIRVTGNGFLYNMVRILAGTLLEVGQGRRTAASVEKALRSGERNAPAGQALHDISDLRRHQSHRLPPPACGLMLIGIEYI